jgi:hypothetical protein
MNITIKIDEVALLNDLLQNLPEYAESFYCTKFDYKKHIYKLEDREDGKQYTLTLDMAKAGLEKLYKEIAAGKLPGLGLDLTNFADGGYWDAPMIDALLQMSVFGEVIYG